MARVDELSPRAGRGLGRNALWLWPCSAAVLVAHLLLLSCAASSGVSALKVLPSSRPALSSMAARVMPSSASLAAPQGGGTAVMKMTAMAALAQPAVQAIGRVELGTVPDAGGARDARDARFAGLALLGASESDATDDGRYLPRPLLTIAPLAQTPVVLLWPTDTGLIGSYSGVLKLFIDEQGRVQRVVLDDEGLPEALAEVARQTFQSLVFSPAELAGQRVKSRIRVEVRFDAEPAQTEPALPR